MRSSWAPTSFNEPEYRERAQETLLAIRAHEALEVPGGWYPAAGDWAVEDRIANLSYFAPYAYPYFDRLDPEGRWMEALETGYELLAQALEPPEVFLVPDFVGVDPSGRVIALPPGNEHSSDFSFDAVRVYWRVPIDCQLHAGPHACSDPVEATELAELFSRDGRLVTRYDLEGSPRSDGESLSFYGAILPALRLHAPDTAERILAARLSIPALRVLQLLPEHYYDLNWVWFGIAADIGWIRQRTHSPDEVSPT